VTGGRSEQQLAEIATRRMKDLHQEIAKRWGIPVGILAGTTLGLGITMLLDSGYSEEQIFDVVRSLMTDLTDSGRRGAS